MPATQEVIVALADEGVPVRVIARAARVPGEDVYEMLHEAIANGTIIELPKDDWPPRGRRADRQPGWQAILQMDDVALRLGCASVFHMSPTQSAVFTAFLKRPTLTKEQVHHAIEAARDPAKKETDIKMVDVIVYHVRKRLKTLGMELKTLWGSGYAISEEDRGKALAMLGDFLNTKGAA